MKLYYAVEACSLSDRISLTEAGMASGFERVDLKTKTTETGADFLRVNPRGYVPALVLDDGETVTENVAVLAWIADRAPQLAPGDPLGRIRLLEMLSYISTELHGAFKPFWHRSTDADRSRAGAMIARRLELVATTMLRGPHLFGPAFTVADAYLLVMLMWAMKFDVQVPGSLSEYFRRVVARESVREALMAEGLDRYLGREAPALQDG